MAASGHTFVVNVTVGTPAQPLSLLLSPNSPNTWLPDAGAMPCSTGFDSLSGFHPSDDKSGSACRWGAFSASDSSTARTAEQVFLDFVVSYTGTIEVRGLNITDRLKLGDIEFDDFSMGLGSSVSNEQWIGILGLGNDPTTISPRPSSRYRPNFADRLVASGKIASQAYSIWLDDAEGKSGTLLLGAIDKSQYEGDLIRLNTVQPYDVFPSAFAVPLLSVKVETDGEQSFKYDGPSFAASLGPAETFSYLPDGLARGIMDASGASWNTTLQRATIPCDAATKKPETTLRFQLEGPDGPVLDAHLAELVIPQTLTSWEIAYAGNRATLNRNTCLFGIQKHVDLRAANDNPQYNLGSSLLRRTYMVFDAPNKAVALAPTKFGVAFSKIVPFEKAGAQIPSSRLYCHAVGDECPAGSDEPASNADTGPTDDESPNSNWKKVVIGVVVPVVVLAILIPSVYMYMRRRKRQTSEPERASRGKEEDTGGEESFKEDEYGVKVTVSVSSKVSVAKAPPSPQFFLGVPGDGFSGISEDRASEYSQNSASGIDSGEWLKDVGK